MSDHYIEVVWNGVRTRVLVPKTEQAFVDHWVPGKPSKIGPNYYAGDPFLTANSLGELFMKIDDMQACFAPPDADSEYDRDVRGE